MGEDRLRLLYLILVPAILVAAGVLGYYTFRSARDHALLGERTIAQSLLSVAQERVGRIERYIIQADNRLLGLVQAADAGQLDEGWLQRVEAVAPSVRGVVILKPDGGVQEIAYRGSRKERRGFQRALRQLSPALDLSSLEPGEWKHLHQTLNDKSYLLSYRIKPGTNSDPRYLIAHHDTEYLEGKVFPSMFVTDATTPLYNVVDENNQRVFGPDLSKAGAYMVGHRFPTTLYGWQLQVAPRQAALLEEQGRSRLRAEVALPISAFAIILLGAIFFIYAAAKERQLNRLKTDLVANVSHELKTPVSVVRMFAEMLRTDRVPSDARREEYLDLICRESERLAALIDNLLDFSALEGGKGPYRLAKGDLRAAVDRALEAFRFRTEQDGIEIEVMEADDLPVVLIDQEAIALAVINLLDNALKYGGGSRLEVALEAKRSAVDVSVRDHGPGIPQDSLKRVFERFYRGRRDNETRGSGIGLSLVKQIARAHGGYAWARNAPDGGAIVGFSIPAA